MSNEVEIVVTGKDNSGSAMASAAAGQKKVADAALAHRKAALEAADADTKLSKAQKGVSDVAEKVRTGELEGAAAMEKTSEAARNLERSSIKVEEAHRKATGTSHELARAQGEVEAAFRKAGVEAEKTSGLFGRMFSKLSFNPFKNFGKDAATAGEDAGKSLTKGTESAAESGFAGISEILMPVLVGAAIAAAPVAGAAIGGHGRPRRGPGDPRRRRDSRQPDHRDRARDRPHRFVGLGPDDPGLPQQLQRPRRRGNTAHP